MRLDVGIVRHQIDNLIAAYPQFADDGDDWSLALASETELDEILTRLLRMIDDARALAEGTDARLQELQARRDRFEQRVEAYRSLILKLMISAGVSKRELPEATVSLKVLPIKVIGSPDPKSLPDDLVVIERRPNRAAIKRALEDGKPVDGCSLSNGGQTISIRVK